MVNPERGELDGFTGTNGVVKNVALAGLITGGCPSLLWQAAEGAGKGDWNGEGRIDSTDVQLILSCSIGKITVLE